MQTLTINIKDVLRRFLVCLLLVLLVEIVTMYSLYLFSCATAGMRVIMAATDKAVEEREEAVAIPPMPKTADLRSPSVVTSAQRQFEATKEAAEKAAAGKAAAEKAALIEHIMEKGPAGDVGRLYIPAIEINVGVSMAEMPYAQVVTDRKDSACWLEWPNSINPVIADHVNQDFAKLSEVQIGDECYVARGDELYKYKCTGTMLGRNTEYDLYDDNGTSIDFYGSDHLAMYTCYNGWRIIFIADWTLVGNEPLFMCEHEHAETTVSEDADATDIVIVG